MRIVLVEVPGQSLGDVGDDLARVAEEGVQHRPAAQQEAAAALLQPQLVPQPRVLQRQLELLLTYLKVKKDNRQECFRLNWLQTFYSEFSDEK